jgi:hypothetical protein
MRHLPLCAGSLDSATFGVGSPPIEWRIIMQVQDSHHTTEEIAGHRPGINWRAGMMVAGVATVAAFGIIMAPTAVEAEPQGYIQDQVGVGYFYGTFDQSPNIALLVGGNVEEFCESDPGDPGTAPGRVFPRSDGSVDIKVNDKDQPIYLYEIDFDDVPPWLEEVCRDESAPEAFATGTADLKVRVSVLSDTLVDVFNSVNGKATGIDGTEYKVRASADLIVKDGMPVGNPADFIGFELKEIKR